MRTNRIAFVLTMLFAFIPLVSDAQGGLIREGLVMSSSILGDDAKYSVYLPDGYEETNRNYPVLYLLHGFSPEQTDYMTWIQFGEVKNIADRQMQTLETTDMIIVMPDAGESFYLNSDKVRYEEFFINEFIPYIDDNYRTRSEKQYRAVAGVSMGGYGTLLYTLKYPDLFAAAAPLSAGLFTDEQVTNLPQERWDQVLGPVFGEGLKGQNRLTDYYLENSILHLVKTGNFKKQSSVRYYIDCGDDDFLIKGNMALHAAMVDKEIPHEFRVRDGAHNWTYWRTALPEVLKFVSRNFHR